MKITLQNLNGDITRPYLKCIISDTSNFINSQNFNNCLIDTGSDIIFINDKYKHLFNPFKEKNQSGILLNRFFFKFPDLNSPIRKLLCEYRQISLNQNFINEHPDILLGRTFLQYYKMTYDGTNGTIIFSY